jgi:hypothetical protein
VGEISRTSKERRPPPQVSSGVLLASGHPVRGGNNPPDWPPTVIELGTQHAIFVLRGWPAR